MCIPVGESAAASKRTECSVFGTSLHLDGSMLADAICQLRDLARSGARDKRVCESEIAALIDDAARRNH